MKLTKVQRAALELASETGTIVCVPGNMWVAALPSGMPSLKGVGGMRYVTTRTVRACERLGWLTRARLHSSYMVDPRRITESGLAAIEADKKS